MRSDIHRPSAIQPADYEFVAFDHVKIEDLGSAEFAREQRERIQRHMARTGGHRSGHEHGGNCGVCGSVNAIYTAMFYHVPTNTYIRVGQDCADQIDAGIVPAFRTFIENARGAREAETGKRKAEQFLTEKGLGQAWTIYSADYESLARDRNGFRSVPYEEQTIRDIVGKLVKFGSISDKQTSFVANLLAKIPQRAGIMAQRAEEKALASDAPTGRVAVTGTILKVEERESDFGLVTKMTVKAVEGFIVWVTMPSGMTAQRGDTVSFKATLTPSDNDPKFCFGKRPTMVAVPQVQPQVAEVTA